VRRAWWLMCGVALAAGVTGVSCGDGTTGPVAGTLTVRLSTPSAGPDGAIMLTIVGPVAITSAEAPSGLRVFHNGFGTNATSVAVTGTLPTGPILTIGVTDISQAAQYTAVIQQVAAADHQLRALAGYALTIERGVATAR